MTYISEPYSLKCSKCPQCTDCDFNTQVTDDNILSGEPTPKRLRNLCSGSPQDQNIMYVSSWYLRGLFQYSLHGKPYLLAYHIKGFIPEIDFTKQIPKILSDIKKTDSEFNKSVTDNILCFVNCIKIYAGPDFKFPKLDEINYIKATVCEKERC
jgi:hypothetical protein